MTTSVVIEAHCAEDTEVIVNQVDKFSPESSARNFRLQNGDRLVLHVWGTNSVNIKEEKKA